MSNLHAIRPATRSVIAEGLEAAAMQIREGEVDPYRAVLVLTCRVEDTDAVGARVYGAEATTSELIGSLALVQHQLAHGKVDG